MYGYYNRDSLDNKVYLDITRTNAWDTNKYYIKSLVDTNEFSNII